jgi:kumamolisin
MPELVPLRGSERTELPGAEPAGELDTSATITVTLILRRRADVPRSLVTGPETLTSAELGSQYGSDPADVALVTEVLGRHGLTVTESSPESRRMKVTGTIGALSTAFGTTLRLVSSPYPGGRTVTHRYRSGGLFVPAELSGIVTAVLGLDDRPQARPQFRRPSAARRTAAPETAVPETAVPETAVPETAVPETAVPEGTVAPQAGPQPGPLTAPQVAGFYKFPAGTDGTGQTISIIELGGGYTASDLDSYFSGLGLATPTVTAVGVDGGSNSPGDPADAEVLLDIQVAGAVAPQAAQVVYFAPNTDQGFVDAVSEAVHATPAPAVISISWGASEDAWSSQSRTTLDAAIADAAVLGVTVCVAAGDNGSSDDPNSVSGVHCDFPASSPHAFACGGTKLVGDVSTFTITSEVVWNELANHEGAGGGGVSDVFGLPSWQSTAGVPTSAGGGSSTTGRGVPDVAGNADPVTGYLVVVNGQRQPIGGTSAVAPLWAGLIARLAQSTGKRFGMLQPLLYAGVTPGVPAAGFNDITEGNNGAYKAGPGWDACTGLGSPNGQALLTRLSS